MKREVNLFVFQPKHRRITADGLLATFRALGMTDEEIKQELLKLKAKQGENGEKNNLSDDLSKL